MVEWSKTEPGKLRFIITPPTMTTAPARWRRRRRLTRNHLVRRRRRRMGELSCLSPEHVNFNSQSCGSIGLYFKKMPGGIVVRQAQFEHVVTRCYWEIRFVTMNEHFLSRSSLHTLQTKYQNLQTRYDASAKKQSTSRQKHHRWRSLNEKWQIAVKRNFPRCDHALYPSWN